MGFLKEHRLAATIVLAVVGIGLIYSPIEFPMLPENYDMALCRIIFSGIVIAGIVLIGGADDLKPEKGTLGPSVRMGMYPMVVSAVLAVLLLASLFEEGDFAVPDDVAVQVLGVVLLSVVVGVFEELVFRYVLFGGLLSRFGNTRGGLMGSLVASSFVFGFVHVAASFEPDAVIIAQMTLKTAEAALMGFVFAACFLVGKNIWGAAIVHAVSDGLLMLVQVFQAGSGVDLGGYVSAGADGVEAILVYGVMIAVFTPCYIKAWKRLKAMPLPENGPFGE